MRRSKTLCRSPRASSSMTSELPPTLRNGSGMPVTGSSVRLAPRFTNTWNSSQAATRRQQPGSPVRHEIDHPGRGPCARQTPGPPPGKAALGGRGRGGAEVGHRRGGGKAQALQVNLTEKKDEVRGRSRVYAAIAT